MVTVQMPQFQTQFHEGGITSDCSFSVLQHQERNIQHGSAVPSLKKKKKKKFGFWATVNLQPFNLTFILF